MLKDNNKEHELMKEELEKFRAAFEMLLEHSKERDVKVDAMVAKVDEMYKVFNNGTFLVSVVKWGFGLVLAVGGGYLMFKQILHGQN
jgi:hypothetical protein